MVYALAAANVLLLVVTVLLARYVVTTRNRRHQRGVFGPWPIRKVRLDEFDPAFATDELGPGHDAEVHFIGKGNLPVLGGTTDVEAWILAVLAKRARLMFEFGTCTGKTTYLWARNCPPEGKVVTLTLSPDDVGEILLDAGDHPNAARLAVEESVFRHFLYSGTDVEKKVVQIFGDSKMFDESSYIGACDLVFVDGNHAYSYVLSDSEKALRMVKPGGIVLWHDYKRPRKAATVFHALNTLSKRIDLVHIEGTALVAHRCPV